MALRSENAFDNIKHGNRVDNRGSNHGNSKLSEDNDPQNTIITYGWIHSKRDWFNIRCRQDNYPENQNWYIMETC